MKYTSGSEDDPPHNSVSLSSVVVEAWECCRDGNPVVACRYRPQKCATKGVANDYCIARARLRRIDNGWREIVIEVIELEMTIKPISFTIRRMLFSGESFSVRVEHYRLEPDPQSRKGYPRSGRVSFWRRLPSMEARQSGDRVSPQKCRLT